MEKRGKDHIRDGERGKGSHPGWGKGKRGMSGKNGKSSTSGMEKWGKVRNLGFRKKRRKRQNLDSGILALLFIEYGPPRKNAR